MFEALKKRLNWLLERRGSKLSPDTRLFEFGLRQAYNIMHGVCREAGVPTFRKRTFYGFRRAETIELLEKELNPVAVAEYRGWRDLRMVPYYYKESAHDIAEKVARLKHRMRVEEAGRPRTPSANTLIAERG